jgi:hypothetical protein
MRIRQRLWDYLASIGQPRIGRTPPLTSGGLGGLGGSTAARALVIRSHVHQLLAGLHNPIPITFISGTLDTHTRLLVPNPSSSAKHKS